MKIEAKELRKVYGKEVALQSFSSKLEGDKIIGLLGKNGAGKTTFLRLLAGHFQPSKGDLTVGGEKPFNNRNVSKDICFVAEANNFKEKFRVRDVLKVASKYYPNWDHARAMELVKVFKLKERQKVKGLSKGMSSALGIIIGLASRAPITIFDEPYIGLDASFRSTFYDLLLEEYELHPRTFILSTHLIDEVSKLFEEVVIIHEGELMLHEKATDLSEQHLLVSGKDEQVESFVKDKNVIHQTNLIGQKSAIIYGGEFDEQEAQAIGLKTEHCSIQELFVHLTKEEVTNHVS
ncbi:ABC transporter ATP-binding protein [Halalkalibacillus sediminis]|uniref:ABC transporter ATP-binding protein n=1 Tax=Halalkalibacillus sediminis TaxID=2018042 RepID=A0A2I0QST4_9BACI|nr:ABC transporter ATP-binding protein [Halalkalibacillus sediminis]PKR77170.1 ABC transporter ATP-binding protein [Halalkalibacillus sediminis]